VTTPRPAQQVALGEASCFNLKKSVDRSILITGI
jgi:hypothetical protein